MLHTSSSVDIIVTDKINKQQKTFTCSRATVRERMPYFRKVVDEQKKHISVNCEVGIFAWLVCWIKDEAPALTPSNAVSVAMASQFLQMPDATDAALRFMAADLPTVLTSDVNMTCLPEPLFARLLDNLDLRTVAKGVVAEEASGSRWAAVNRQFFSKLVQEFLVRKDTLEELKLRVCSLCGFAHCDEDVAAGVVEVRREKCPMKRLGVVGARGVQDFGHTPIVVNDPMIPRLFRSDKEASTTGQFIDAVASVLFVSCVRCEETFRLADMKGCSRGTEHVVDESKLSIQHVGLVAMVLSSRSRPRRLVLELPKEINSTARSAENSTSSLIGREGHHHTAKEKPFESVPRASLGTTFNLDATVRDEHAAIGLLVNGLLERRQ